MEGVESSSLLLSKRSIHRKILMIDNRIDLCKIENILSVNLEKTVNIVPYHL